MDFAITGKKIKATPNPLQPQISTPSKTTYKKPTTKVTQPVNRPKPAASSKPSLKVNSSQPPKQNNSTPKKQEVKQQSPKKEQKQQKVKQQQEKVVEEQPAKVEEEKPEDILGQVIVRYNHYKEKFPTKNGVLSFVPIEDKYMFSDLFKGNFIPVIKTFKGMEQIEPQSKGTAINFSWKVDANIDYRLQIQEDEQEESKYEKKIYKAPTEENKCPFKKNRRVQEITEQLKNLRPEQYGTQIHKRLLQQRDVEDVLYS